MVSVIGVRFKRAGKIYFFDPKQFDIAAGDHVIVETIRGIEYGKVVSGIEQVDEKELVSQLKPVIRKADQSDCQKHQANRQKAKDAMITCQQKIAKHGLEMKLIDAEYTFDNNKVIFYFTADGRVDFRELVKDLAAVFRTRIELRQIGVRDEAKMINGIGQCGRRLCCANWLSEFVPVSIKMAKDQNLSLNPTKISGICSRLMCCLRYEYDTYKSLRKQMPRVGDMVKTPDGEALVFGVNILKETVRVKLIVSKSKGSEPELGDDFLEFHRRVVIRNNRTRYNFTKKMVESGGTVQLQDQDDEVFAEYMQDDGFIAE